MISNSDLSERLDSVLESLLDITQKLLDQVMGGGLSDLSLSSFLPSYT